MTDKRSSFELEARGQVLHLIAGLPDLMEMTIEGYFFELADEVKNFQQKAINRHAAKTIHDLLVEVHSVGIHEDFEILMEIKRKPTNHLNMLYGLYDAAFLPCEVLN